MTNLKSIRTKRNITQYDLAVKCNISLSTLKAYEQGLKPVDGSKIRTLAILANALNCRIEDLIDDQDTKQLIRKIYGS